MAYDWNDFRDHPDIDVEWADSDNNRARSRLSWKRRPRSLQHQSERQINNLVVGLLIVFICVLIGAVAFVSNDMSTKGPHIPGEGDTDNVVIVPQIPTTQSPSDSSSSVPSGQPSISSSQPPPSVNSTAPSSSAKPSVAPTEVLKAPPAPEPVPTENTTVYCVDQDGFFYNHAGENVTCGWFDTVGSYIKKRNCGKTGVGRACLLACSDHYDCTIPERNETLPPTEEPTSSPTSSPTKGLPKSLVLTVSADTTIKESSPLANLGSASWIKVDTDSGVFNALLKFDLKGHIHSRTVESATLRLKAASDCPSGGYLQRTHHPNWDENSVTWSTAPGGDGTEIARLPAIKRGYWYTVDVTKALSTGHNVLSMRLFPVSTSECMFESKENSSGSAPELNIMYGD